MPFPAYRMFDGNGRERDSTAIPGALIVGTTNPRLRVDVAETGFFEGREARTFREFVVAAGSTLAVQVNIAVNTVIADIQCSIVSGSIRFSTKAQCVESGTWNAPLPILRKNNMLDAPAYTPQNSFFTGGSVSGGTDLDLVLMDAGFGSGRSSVGASAGSGRGVAPGRYHFVLQNLSMTAASQGFLSLFWEERL